MPGISQLRRGRRLALQAKRARLRRAQPRYAGNKLRSQFKAPPRRAQREQPYLGTNIKLADLL